MEREYLIMDIVDGQDSKYGKILIVKANPVTTNSLGLRYASDIRGTHTELFHLPLSKRYIDPLVQIAQNQQIWSPNENDYKDERVRDERNNRILTVHRHKDLINAFQLSKPKMKYHVKEITFNNSDFSKLEETWDFSENGIDTPHGSISFNSFMEVSQSGMNGLQFDTDGILYFDDIDNCPLEDAYISTVAVMRQPFNAWLWLYLINEDGVTIASICGHDDLGGFSKYVANLRKAYQ